MSEINLSNVNLPRDSWYRLYRIMRENSYVCQHDESVIGNRARLARRIKKYAVNGLIGFNTAQMDCDCVSFSSFENLPAYPVFVEHAIDRLYQNAEGPVSYGLTQPNKRKPGTYGHRDLALEAFENGHPHSICY